MAGKGPHPAPLPLMRERGKSRKLTIAEQFAYSVTIMISVHDALAMILETVSPLAGERVGLLQAVGRVLAEEVRSEREVPPFANSAMDFRPSTPGGFSTGALPMSVTDRKKWAELI